MSPLSVIVAVASAASWSGVPVDPTLVSEPTFLYPESGWSARLIAGDGRVRTHVARDDEAARTWLAERLLATGRALPEVPFTADESYGDASCILLARFGNVAIEIDDASCDAMGIGARLMASLAPLTDWPQEPTVVFDGTRVSVSGEWNAVRYEVSPILDRLQLRPVVVSVVAVSSKKAVLDAPAASIGVTVWDEFGRGVVVRATSTDP
jgi:hypothetical protein